MVRRKKRKKVKCEVCGEVNTKILERHHIIPRKDIMCTNDDYNLAILCANCHSKIHTGILNIIGVFPSTDPSGVTLVYELNGKKNIDINEPYFIPKPIVEKVYYGRKDFKIDGYE